MRILSFIFFRQKEEEEEEEMGSGKRTGLKHLISSGHRHQNHQEHDEQQQQTPKDFLCPISGQLMADPVVLPTGQTFERNCIQACLLVGIDPPSHSLDSQNPSLTTSTVLVPNLALRSTICAWCDSHGIDRPQPISPQAALSLVRSLTSSPSTSLDDIQIPPLQKEVEEEEEEEKEAERQVQEKEDVFYSCASMIPNHPRSNRHNISVPITPQYSSTSTSSSPLSSSSSDEFGNNKKPPCSPLEEQILAKLKSAEVTEQETGLLLLRTRARECKEERVLLCTDTILSALGPFLISRLPTFQSNAVAAVVNLSLNPVNKVPIIRSGAVPPLISALKSVDPEIRSHAAAAMFSLAVEESCKAAIGALGALPPLLGMIAKSSEQEDVGTRRDAALALYNLSTTCSTNRLKLTRMGGAKILLGIIVSDQEMGKLGGVMLKLVGNLARCLEGRAALMDAGAIDAVVGMIRKISSSTNDSGDNKQPKAASTMERIERCVAVLYELSRGSLRFYGLAKSAGVEEVLEELAAEDGFVGDQQNKGGDGARTKEMVRRMLKAMNGEALAGDGSFDLVAIGIDVDDDARSAFSDPAAGSGRYGRSHLVRRLGAGRTAMARNREAYAGGESFDNDDCNVHDSTNAGLAVPDPAVASQRRGGRSHLSQLSGVSNSCKF